MSARAVILDGMELPENLGADRSSEPAPQTAADAPSPVPVGEYAHRLVAEMRARPRVTITGELCDVRRSRVQVYFQLRDDRGGVACTMWKDRFEALALPPEALRDGAQVIATGGPDYYVGGPHASPAFSFRVTGLRLAGEGDLLARLAALRRQFAAEGLLDLQKGLPRPVLPRRIGVITAEGGAARQDLMAGLARRGWQGELVWGFAPVQDRKAAPAITRTLSEMAAFADVEAIVVCRGGGSLTDLWAFCDETLCRTAALLAVPVYSAVGHERDVTLLDDVAAVRCSTPTHAAEAVIRVDCHAERAALVRRGARIAQTGPAAVRERARPLAALAAGPARALRQERGVLNQKTREIAAAARRGVADRAATLENSHRRHLAPAAGRAAALAATARAANAQLPGRLLAAAVRTLGLRERNLAAHEVAMRAHNPQRVLERGYARVEDRAGDPVTGPKAARRAIDLRIHFAAGQVDATVGGRRRRRAAGAADAGEAGENGFEQTTLEGIEDDE